MWKFTRVFTSPASKVIGTRSIPFTYALLHSLFIWCIVNLYKTEPALVSVEYIKSRPQEKLNHGWMYLILALAINEIENHHVTFYMDSARRYQKHGPKATWYYVWHVWHVIQYHDVSMYTIKLTIPTSFFIEATSSNDNFHFGISGSGVPGASHRMIVITAAWNYPPLLFVLPNHDLKGMGQHTTVVSRWK